MKALSRLLKVVRARLVSFRSSEVSSKLPTGWASIGKRRISKSDIFDDNSAKCGVIFSERTNVNSRSLSLYAIARPSIVCLSACRQ